MFYPQVVYAATDVKVLVQKVSFFIFNPLISILFGIAVVFFIWGVVQYYWFSDSDEARTKGVKHMTWGIVGIVIMIASFAIVAIINNTLGGPAETRVDPSVFRPAGTPL